MSKKEVELQVVEIKPEKTNEEKIQELLEKVSVMENRVADRKKKKASNQ